MMHPTEDFFACRPVEGVEVRGLAAARRTVDVWADGTVVVDIEVPDVREGAPPSADGRFLGRSFFPPFELAIRALRIAFALVVIFFTVIWMAQLRCCPTADDQYVSEKELLRLCLKKTVVAPPSGHVGFRGMQFASTLALARAFNLTPLAAEHAARPLSAGFLPLSAPTVDQYLAEMPASDPGLCAGFLNEDAVLNLRHRWNGLCSVPQISSSGPTVLPNGMIFVNLIAPIVPELRNLLAFKPGVIRHAQQVLGVIRKKMTMEFDIAGDQIVYIGMHIRRSDFLKYLDREWKITKPADEGFFVRALERMQKDLEGFVYFNTTLTSPVNTISNNIPASRHVAYAVVISSDDMTWVKKVLVPALKKNLADRQEKMVRVIAKGGGTDHKTFGDLALLASCNHTVISYGMYGTLAAILAGGRTIVFDVEVPGYPTLEFARQIPYWSAMR